MPLLAGFIGAITGGLASFLARFIGFGLALKLASYMAWIATFTVFLTSVYVCCSSLYQMMSSMVGSGGGGGGGGGNWVGYFWMGLGMFIPSNAGAVIACISSVWIATSIFKIQRVGIENFSK